MKKLLSKKKLKINILVVGGTGFIGKHLLHKLSKNKFNIFNLSKKLEEKLIELRVLIIYFVIFQKKKNYIKNLINIILK